MDPPLTFLDDCIVVPEKPTLNHIWGISKTFIIIASNLDPWSGSFGIFYDLAL